MAIHFDKFAQEGNTFINELSEALGHKDETQQAGILLRATLHTLRDSMAIAESFHVMAQLPILLKGIYVENWQYGIGKPRFHIKTLKDFAREVEIEQTKYGEAKFNWEQSTIEIVKGVFSCLGKYIDEGEYNHIKAQFPDELAELFPTQAKAA